MRTLSIDTSATMVDDDDIQLVDHQPRSNWTNKIKVRDKLLLSRPKERSSTSISHITIRSSPHHHHRIGLSSSPLPSMHYLSFIIFLLLNVTISIVQSAIQPPRDLSVHVKSGKVVQLDWNPPKEGRFNSFKITIEPLSQQDDSGIRTIVIGVDDPTPVAIRDLTPGASYEVRLHTVYRNEESWKFLRANFTTIPATLPEPKIWFRNETTLWVKLANPAETIFDHYKVQILPEDAYEPVRVLERPELGLRPSVAFHGLIPGKSYNISVQTKSFDKWSEPSIATFTTMPFAPSDSREYEDYRTPTSGFHSNIGDSHLPSLPSHSPPMFTNGGPPETLTIQDGRDAEIQCEATGAPFPAVEWWFKSAMSPTSERNRLDVEAKQKYDTNAHGALVITQVEKSDDGEYTCLRSNNLGTINGTTRLNVILRTQIYQPPVDSKVILSSTAELECRVRHDPSIQVKIYWTFNKKNLTSLTSSRVKISQDGTLRIEQVRNTDVGLYTCRVESDGGNEKRSARLDVIELPHPPTNVHAELNVNGGLVNVSWTAPFDGNSPIIKYVVQMRTVSNSQFMNHQTDSLTNTNDNNASSSSNGGNSQPAPSTDDELVYGVNTWTTASMNISSTQNFVLITNLRPATTYQFRVSAVNSVGEGQPSSPTNPPITLPAQPPNASPVGVVGAPRSSTAITIQWQQPPVESHNGQLMGYIVRYKLAGYAEHTPWYTYNVTNSVQMSCLLEDLIVWQNYQIQVAAYNEMGIGVYSPSIYVRTKEGRPAAQVRYLEAEALNSTTIRVKWMPPDPQLINGINQGYKVQAWLSKNSSFPSNIDGQYETNTLYPVVDIRPAREITVPPTPSFHQDGQQSALITGLEPYTTYDITALCFTSAGDGPRFEPPSMVTTMQDLPSEVGFLKFRDILDKSVRVIWSRPKRVNGKLKAYTLRYYVVSMEQQTAITSNLSATENQTIISNLKPQTAYTFEINAWTEVGPGPVISSTIQSSVPPVLPVAPTHLAISNIQPFSVVLQFTPGFNGNASITRWIVEGQLFKLRNTNDWSVIYESTNHTQDDAITVHNLRPYTEYRLRLIPVNVVGPARKPSESSPPFQTLQALPQGPPSNVTVRTVSATALRVRWTPLPPEAWHGHPRGYNITWRQLANDGQSLSDQPLRSHILSDYHSHSYLIVSLNEYTNYGIQVYALNDLGTSTGSHYIIQRTNEATPSSGPRKVDVRSTSSTTIVVDWDEIPETDRNGIIQGFKVRYSAIKNGAGSSSVLDNGIQFKLIENNSSRTATLTELKKYTKYQISVCGYTHVGDGVYSTGVIAETFQDVPGPPSNVTFPDVTLTTARIKWDVPEEPNGEILAYKISYSLSDDYVQHPGQHNRMGRSNHPKPGIITREFQSSDRTHRFLDLLPESYYMFEVMARTVEGWGQPAKALVYTTNTRELPQPPSQPLISVSQISSRQVTISWTPGRDGYAPLRYYTVQISSQGGHWWTYPMKIDPISRSYTVTNLKPFTTYQFRLKATNDIGDSGWSSESPITRTLPAPPDTVPQNVIVSPFTPTSISVRWIPVADWNGDEMGAGYRVQYCLITEQGVSGSCPSALVRGKNRTQAEIDNLERDQHYEIRVIAFNGQGDGPSTKPKVVYVGEAVPTGEPLDIRAEPLSSTEIKVTWQPPDQSKQNGQIMGYKIFYAAINHHLQLQNNSSTDKSTIRTGNPTITNHEMKEIVPDTLESFILLDLLKWTNYSIQISAFNPAGDGPRSKPTIVQTKEDIPGEIGPIQFEEITMSQVKVSWKPPMEPNGVLLGYYITYETLIGDFSKQVKQKINDSYLVVSSLRERVTYTFKVRAENSIGLGPERTGNVTTGPQPGSPSSPFELITQQTLTSVKLKWKNAGETSNPILGYLIEANNLNKKSALEWQPIVTLRNGRQERYELSFTQLSPSSQYQFRIMSFNRLGVSEPAYPNKLYGGSGSAIISTPSHLELRARMPYYRETWFVILCACLSVIITIMVIAALCVHNKTYKYRKEAMKNGNGSTGSQDRLSELGFGLDDHFDNPLVTTGGSGTLNGQTLEMMSMMNGAGATGGSTLGLMIPPTSNALMTMASSSGHTSRNDRTRATLQRKKEKEQQQNMLNTAAISAQARQPPRPCPGSFNYSDEDDLDMDGSGGADGDELDIKPPPGSLYEMSSGNDSLTEKPSELSSTGPDSEDSDDHDDLVAANMFCNHYANVNDTLRKSGSGMASWKKQAKPYIVPTGSSQHASSSSHHRHPPSHHPPPPPPPPSGQQQRSSYKPLPNYPPSAVTNNNRTAANTPPPPPPPPPPTNNESHFNIHQQPNMIQAPSNILQSAHSQTSINSSNHSSRFPSRPPPPTPAPPSYLSALQATSVEHLHHHATDQPDGNIGASQPTNLTQQQPNSASQNTLNGGRIIVNNMAGSRAPLPGFSSFV